MVNSIFWNILGIILFIILLFIGMKLSKKNAIYPKASGYILILVGIAGIFAEIYNLIHNIIA